MSFHGNEQDNQPREPVTQPDYGKTEASYSSSLQVFDARRNTPAEYMTKILEQYPDPVTHELITATYRCLQYCQELPHQMVQRFLKGEEIPSLWLEIFPLELNQQWHALEKKSTNWPPNTTVVYNPEVALVVYSQLNITLHKLNTELQQLKLRTKKTVSEQLHTSNYDNLKLVQKCRMICLDFLTGLDFTNLGITQRLLDIITRDFVSQDEEKRILLESLIEAINYLKQNILETPELPKIYAATTMLQHALNDIGLSAIVVSGVRNAARSSVGLQD